jgi:hypothetical protein
MSASSTASSCPTQTSAIGCSTPGSTRVVHEMGRALVALTLPGTVPVQKAAILLEVGALGYTSNVRPKTVS